MKFYNIKDIDGFFNTLQTCEGTVELVTSEGDCLNLKSKLSQLVVYANVFSGEKIPEMEIRTSKPEDMAKLVSFVVTAVE